MHTLRTGMFQNAEIHGGNLFPLIIPLPSSAVLSALGIIIIVLHYCTFTEDNYEGVLLEVLRMYNVHALWVFHIQLNISFSSSDPIRCRFKGTIKEYVHSV